MVSGSSSSHDAPPAALELAIVAGDGITLAPLPARGAVTLGRGEECEVRIRSRSVSRRHAILHLDPPLRIEDLGSANGTFVRDTRSPHDTVSTQPLRKLSREVVEIAIGERVNVGAIPVVVRRVAAPVGAAAAGSIVVHAPAMRALYEQAARAARSPISVLILGETGVGKEVLARSIHERSPRAGGPFLELNCAALPQSLLESELFGHEKGAFTGATQARAGLLESADGGTILFDEVGELPLAVQVKLLRVLEELKVLRVGGRTPRTLDVRFVFATNRSLEAEVSRGTFRQDLYFRINGVTLTIPPLRERLAEIVPLAEQFLDAASRRLDRVEPLRLSGDTVRYLERYRWPGNVRELRNVIERAAALSSGGVIVPADLPAHLTNVATGIAPLEPELGASGAPAPAGGPAAEALVSAAGKPLTPQEIEERGQILEALEQCAGNQTRAARRLGISLRTLVKRIEKYGVRRPRLGPSL